MKTLIIRYVLISAVMIFLVLSLFSSKGGMFSTEPDRAQADNMALEMTAPQFSVKQEMESAAREMREERERLAAQEAARQPRVVVRDFKWKREGFGSMMTASFTIENLEQFDVKDVEISCFHAAKSGTIIDKNVRTVYDIVRAGESKRIENFDMGFIHAQTAASKALVSGAVPIW